MIDSHANTIVDPTINADAMRRWSIASGLKNREQTVQALEELLPLGIPADLLAILWKQLPPALVELKDSDAGLSQFVRYLSRSRSPQSVVMLFDRDRSSLPMLLTAMAVGPTISETLIVDPEAFELLRITDGQPVLRQALLDDVRTEVVAAREDSQVSRTLRRFRQRETLRIAFGQFFRQVAACDTFHQLSYLAEAILQSAFERAYREVSAKFGDPMHPNGSTARCCVIAMGQLGALQQGYDSTLQLLILAETGGRTNAQRIIANTDFFDRLSNCFLAYLTTPLTQEAIYRLQIVKPSQLKSESTVVEFTAAFHHYDLRGRTWERQSFVQAQPIAGDLSLGETFLEQLQPWIYRRFLSDADIAGLGANQRKLQRKLSIESRHPSNTTDGCRASEDIEQMVLFLQLLHGHEFPSIRVGNTALALDRLLEKHLIRESEYTQLQSAYFELRRNEAWRFLQETSLVHHSTADERRHIGEVIDATKTTIGLRLDESFPESQATAPETDLVLDPHPNLDWLERVLTKHHFTDPVLAYKHLTQLSEENVSVLSTRRCRYFLSKIAPKLLDAIAQSPDPDQTLSSLASMTESLGGKGILWELLASSPATMQLIVRICACSSYLVSLLTRSPGMIDELMDSLLVDRLPRRDELESSLFELCRSADDIDRVLHEFKNSMHLRVGVRDVLGKESIVDTHRALSDIAEVSLCRIISDEYAALEKQFGSPVQSSLDFSPIEYAVLALGKLGGQEPNYHSDLSLVLLFDHDGTTQQKKGSRSSGTTTARHFFEQLAQRLMRRTNHVGSHTRLFELDVRFGPLGKSGVLAMQLEQFLAYFHTGQASIAERQSLCKARPIAGSLAFPKLAIKSINELLSQTPFSETDRDSILAFRREMQISAKIQNLKRGEGGTVDVECLVQLLQLTHAHTNPEILVPGTLEAIGMLERAEILVSDDAQQIYKGYFFLREIEAGLRLMNTSARHDLPENPAELNRLAVLLGGNSGQELRDHVNKVRAIHLAIFDRYTQTSI